MPPDTTTSEASRPKRSFFEGTPLSIKAGSNGRIYHVHPEALASCNSAVLNARVNGPWKDAGEKTLDWTDFDELTVERVLCFLYSNDYAIITSHDKGANKLPVRQTGIGPQTPSGDRTGRSLAPMEEVRVGLPRECVYTAAGVVSKMGREVFEQHAAWAIPIHASVYVFAHHYLFWELAQFALQRLTQVLKIALSKETKLLPGLAEAIRVVYAATPSARVGRDPARALLSHFAALRFIESEGGGELDTLMAEGGDFAVDVSQNLTRRIRADRADSVRLAHEYDQLHRDNLMVKSELEKKKVKLEEKRRLIKEWDLLIKNTSPWFFLERALCELEQSIIRSQFPRCPENASLMVSLSKQLVKVLFEVIANSGPADEPSR